MNRISMNAPHNWRKWVEKQGLLYHDIDSDKQLSFWCPDAYYQFQGPELEVIHDQLASFYQEMMTAATLVIEQKQFREDFGFSPLLWEWIEHSWERDDLSIYGRFDLVYDGVDPHSCGVYELNAQTATTLYESVIQADWVKAFVRIEDQWNDLHQALTSAWGYVARKGVGEVHFICDLNEIEDAVTTFYLQETAQAGGIETFDKVIGLEEVLLDYGKMVDPDNVPIRAAFMLHPWEVALEQIKGDAEYLAAAKELRWFEPPWRMVLSSKVIFHVMTQTGCQHPYLLPTYLTPPSIPHVKKPSLGRGGSSVSYSEGTQASIHAYDHYVYQAYRPLPNLGGYFPQLGVWQVGEDLVGLSVREADDLTITEESRFVPHVIGE
jgi:glutathionylspermidine synthase